MTKVDKRIREIAIKVKAKRPKTVIDHILKHGFITTEDLKDIYGYNHPPRAIRDVREQGIPITTYRVKGSDGRSIAAYKFGNPEDIENFKLGGRKIFSKKFKKTLIVKYGAKCAITGERFDPLYLQIDHRIPYEIAGEEIGNERTPERFMLLSGSAQRQKSWSCENCKNFLGEKDINICKSCYWASPEKYTHIATEDIRQVEIIWSGEDMLQYKQLMQESTDNKISIQDTIKSIINNFFSTK